MRVWMGGVGLWFGVVITERGWGRVGWLVAWLYRLAFGDWERIGEVGYSLPRLGHGWRFRSRDNYTLQSRWFAGGRHRDIKCLPGW